MNRKKHNQKVADSRGESWRKNLILSKVSNEPTKLMKLRVEKGFSQEIMAQKLYLPTTTYSAIEKGIRPVLQDRAELISTEFSKHVSQLFVKKNDKFKARK